MAFGPPKGMKVPLPVIPSAARNLLVLFFIVKSRFLAALGMTGPLGDFRQSESPHRMVRAPLGMTGKARLSYPLVGRRPTSRFGENRPLNGTPSCRYEFELRRPFADADWHQPDPVGLAIRTNRREFALLGDSSGVHDHHAVGQPSQDGGAVTDQQHRSS